MQDPNSLHIADMIETVYKQGSYQVLRTTVQEKMYDAESLEYIGTCDINDWVVVDEHQRLVRIEEAESVIDKYWHIVNERVAAYVSTRPGWIFGYPKEFETIKEVEVL